MTSTQLASMGDNLMGAKTGVIYTDFSVDIDLSAAVGKELIVLSAGNVVIQTANGDTLTLLAADLSTYMSYTCKCAFVKIIAAGTTITRCLVYR